MTTTFEYGSTTIDQLQVSTQEADSKAARQRLVTQVSIGDEPFTPTERFWTSLYVRYGFSKSFFNYFSHAEVFERISEVSGQDTMRYCIERDSRGRGRLLAVSNPKRPLLQHDDLMELLDRYQGDGVTYHNGVVESFHMPRMGNHRFQISGDDFSNRFVLRAPVDGYGLPNIYLSLLRQVCANGMVGYSRSFRSEISLGRGNDQPSYSLVRALDGFGNDEGYAALRQRFESAGSSWASVHEAVGLYNALSKLIGRGLAGHDGAETRIPTGDDAPRSAQSSLPSASEGSALLKAFHKMTGDVSQIYGLANLDALSSKRQRTLPVGCKVYDLLNFATEIATHRARPEAARNLQAWVGTTISQEFDLEGTADNYGDFRDFFVDDQPARKTLDKLEN